MKPYIITYKKILLSSKLLKIYIITEITIIKSQFIGCLYFDPIVPSKSLNKINISKIFVKK
jgi:hypothetical protein